MLIAPKLALITTAFLMAAGLLWVGFVESGRSQVVMNGAAGFVTHNPDRFIAAETLAASGVSAIFGSQGSPAAVADDNNSMALKVSASAITVLIMVTLGFARFRPTSPSLAQTVRRLPERFRFSHPSF